MRLEDERERLAILHRLAILDTPEELIFDRITRLASAILEVPIALVSFVDADRQWFKSRIGLDVRQTPREVAFCARAIEQTGPMIVEDASRDPRFAHNPLVLEDPRIRFYAGVPLKAGSNHSLGTLCAIDRRPRVIPSAKIAALEDLAALVDRELELRVELRLSERRTILMELADEAASMGRWWIEGNTVTEMSAGTRRILEVPDTPETISVEAMLAEFHVDDRRTFIDALHRARSSGDRFDLTLRTNTARAGEFLVDVHGRAGLQSDQDGSVTVYGTFANVTEREQLRSRVVHAEKMATIGTLAAGVAHEINNPLAYIKGNTEVLAEEFEEIAGGNPSARMQEFVSMIKDVRDGTDRIHRIVQDLGAFARTSNSKLELVELPEAIETSRRLCANEIRHKARFVVQADPATPMIWADESQLVQVVVNLLINAVHATPNDQLSEYEIVARCGSTEPGRAYIEIVDSGVGLTEAQRRRAFDPFYTTKPDGVGTGLGLSIVHGIVQSFGGTIELLSNASGGTTARVELPAHADSEPSGIRTPEQAGTVQHQPPLRILYIDDDVLVARSLARLLRDHHVTLETNPASAVERLKDGQSFDTIICDLMMPEMTGDQFYSQMVEFQPRMKNRTLFVTGGVFSKQVSKFVKTVDAPILTKPIDGVDFRKAIEALQIDESA